MEEERAGLNLVLTHKTKCRLLGTGFLAQNLTEPAMAKIAAPLELAPLWRIVTGWLTRGGPEQGEPQRQ